MDHKHKEILSQWFDLDNESSDLIIEMNNGGLVHGGVGVFSEGVLIGVVAIDGGLMVPGGDDIDVIVR
jgi:hypothetical protein